MVQARQRLQYNIIRSTNYNWSTRLVYAALATEKPGNEIQNAISWSILTLRRWNETGVQYDALTLTPSWTYSWCCCCCCSQFVLVATVLLLLHDVICLLIAQWAHRLAFELKSTYELPRCVGARLDSDLGGYIARLRSYCRMHASLQYYYMHRVTYKLGVIMHRCRHGNARQYLVDCCTPVTDVGRQRLRSATQQMMVVPRHRLSTVNFAVTYYFL